MKTRMLITSVALAGALAAMNLPAQEGVPEPVAAAAAEPAKEMSGLDQWALYWKQGGKTMWFIALLSVLGMGCALERFWNLRRSRIVPDGFAAEVISVWKEGRFDDVAALCKDNGSMLARVVETMLQHRESGDYAEVKMFAEDKAGRELRLENRKAAMLSTAATLSPLLGLFGTVLGLLGAFGTVAAMGEMGDASVLADDIGKALVTTVAGLAVSMPCLFLFGLVKNRLNLYAVLLEEEVADLVNRLFARK